MSSVPYFTLVSKQSTYVHVNYHQSSFHFMKKFLHQSNFHLIRKKLLLSIQLLLHDRNIFHQWNFYLSNDIFSWIQLLFTIKIISINPTSILNTGMFSSIPLLFRESISVINPASILISNNLA